MKLLSGSIPILAASIPYAAGVSTGEYLPVDTAVAFSIPAALAGTRASAGQGTAQPRQPPAWSITTYER